MKRVFIAASILLILIGVGAGYLVLSGTWEDRWLEPPQTPDYSAAKDENEIIRREYARYKQLSASGQRYKMHPRAEALLDTMQSLPDEYQFRVRVTRHLYEIMLAQAEQFRLSHPDLWTRASTQPKGDNANLCNATDAALPHALGTEQQVEDIEGCEFITYLNQEYGSFDKWGGALLTPRQLREHGRQVDDFLEESSVLMNLLETTLSKRRVFYPGGALYEGEWELALPVPVHWDRVMALRVQGLLLRGRADEARRLAFAMLELMERAQLSKSLIGGLWQAVIFTDRYISRIVRPCVRAGALSGDDLADIYRRGPAVGYDLGYSFGEAAVGQIFSVFGSIWTKNFSAGSAGLPKLAMQCYGKVSVEEWFEAMETKRANALADLERELPALFGGEYVLRDEDGLRRIVQVWGRLFAPWMLRDVPGNCADSYLAQLRWIEVWILAEEVRLNRPIGEWPNPTSAIQDLPGYTVKLDEDKLEVWADAKWFQAVGITLNRKAPEYVIPLSR